jgi:AcrR family transcriptional regulator
MTRTVNETRPGELLDQIVAYIAKHGVTELSLRPLAKAVRSSPRVLLYYFGSKEQLIAKAIKRMRERQRATFGKMREARYEQPSDACRAIWKQMSAPESLAAFRLSLETFAMALRHPESYSDFLNSSVEDWLQFLSAPLVRKGVSESEARAFATVVIAGFRGFLLDYCASGDRERVDQAVEMWLGTLNTIARIPENSHGN